MNIVLQQSPPESTPLAGIAHATWVSAADGLSQLSIWRQTLAPGASTPPHFHDCDEVVLCVGGRGEVHTEDQVRPFGANSTVVLPRGAPHRLINAGALPLEMIGIFAATPVGTRLPDGQSIELPWAS